MSMRAVWKRCKRCGNMWSWNPSVGQTKCPYCEKKAFDGVKTIEHFLNSIFHRDGKDNHRT